MWNSGRDRNLFTQRRTNPHLEGSSCEEQLYSIQVVGDARLFDFIMNGIVKIRFGDEE